MQYKYPALHPRMAAAGKVMTTKIGFLPSEHAGKRRLADRIAVDHVSH